MSVLEPRPITIPEGNARYIDLLAYVRQPGQARQPLDLTVEGRTVEFVVKATPAEPDSRAMVVYVNGAGVAIVTDLGEVNRARVAIGLDATGLPGRYFWRWDVLELGQRATIGYGPFNVTDV